MHQLVKMTPPPLTRDDRRRNQTGAYQVKTACRERERRSEIRADRRVNDNRAFPRILFMPVGAWAKRFAWPWVLAQLGL